MDGNEHGFIFSDLELGSKTQPRQHHLAILLVKCNVSDDGELMVWSTQVADRVNVTVKTYMHSCVFWVEEKEEWAGDGCKVSRIFKYVKAEMLSKDNDNRV